MEEIITYAEASAYLVQLFDDINEFWFQSELEQPVITIQSTPKAYGHYTLYDVWSVKEEKGYHEINIAAGGLNRPIENVIATLIHECVHYYCDSHHIKDTSNRGVYHNKRFKEEAEKRGLIISHHDTYGWTITEPSEELKEWISSREYPEIRIGRKDSIRITGKDGNGSKGGTAGIGKGDTGTNTRKKSSTRKYQCPLCGISIRATKEVHLLCMECMVELMEVS